MGSLQVIATPMFISELLKVVHNLVILKFETK